MRCLGISERGCGKGGYSNGQRELLPVESRLFGLAIALMYKSGILQPNDFRSRY
jgi:hypothetical protein